MFFVPTFVFGMAILILGVVLTLDRLGLGDALQVLRFWPLLLILFGASVVSKTFCRTNASLAGQRQRSGGGLVFLAMLLMFGFFFSNFVQSRDSGRTGALQLESDTRRGDRGTVFSVMSQSARALTSDARRADVASVMGKSTLDLRQLPVAPGESVVVNAFTVMGKSIIRVPDTWVVEMHALPVMGGVDDIRWPGRAPTGDQASPLPSDEKTSAAAANPPRLVIRGFALMGRIQVIS